MALLEIADEDRQVSDPQAIQDYLHGIGIGYDRWTPSHPLAATASSKEILSTYASEMG